MTKVESWVVGRHAELAVIARFLAAPAVWPRALRLQGEAGIGKSTLLDAGLEEARRQGFCVLTCRAAEREARLSYSAIEDLLGGVLDDDSVDVPVPHRHALEVALLRREPEDTGPDRRAVAVGVLSALRALGTSGPVAIGVDDLQWLDGASALALTFALRRLTGSRVAVLATLRLARGETDRLDLPSAVGAEGTIIVDVGPLEAVELAHVVRRRLAGAVTPPLMARIQETAQGNPFFALELARGLDGRSTAAGRPLPIPRDVDEALRIRLRRLSPSAQDVLLMIAAMARPTVELLLATSDETSLTLAGLSEVEEAGMVIVEGDRIRFAHPLFGSTVYWAVPEQRRRAVHARLAASAPDIEERARHIGLAGWPPDSARAELVEQAAGRARSRGAPLTAAELLELSADITPVDDKAALIRRRRLAALHRFDAGDVRRARDALEDLIEALPPGEDQASIKVDLAARYWNDINRVRERLLEALADAPRQDGFVFHATIHALLAWVAIARLELEESVQRARTAVEIAESSGDPIMVRVSLAALARTEMLCGRDPGPMLRRMDAIEEPTGLGELTIADSIRGEHELWAGRLVAARAFLERTDRRCAEAGVELLRRDPLASLAELECIAGNWSEAERLADEAYDIAAHTGLEEVRDHVLYVKALVAALMGRVEAARRDATEGLELAQQMGDRWAELRNRGVLGLLEVSLEEPLAAVEILEPALRVLSASDVKEPGVFRFVPDLIEALVALGDTDRAGALADDLRRRASDLDRPLTLATAWRSQGLIDAASGSPDSALHAFELALAHHESVDAPFELARTHFAQGECLRRMRRKRDARRSLAAAVELFERLGAPLWERRAVQALARIGGRSTSKGLTEMERRVAELVAQGLTNQETADRLFISVKTVESNLRRVYRKVGVRSRTELARRAQTAQTSPGELEANETPS